MAERALARREPAPDSKDLRSGHMNSEHSLNKKYWSLGIQIAALGEVDRCSSSGLWVPSSPPVVLEIRF
jgi:hypothetical protein